jgi:hypothetical protein
MMNLPCFCKKGVLSQCVAIDYSEQQSCQFFTKSGFADRCMNKNEQMEDHCWSAEAQVMGLQAGDPQAQDADTEAYELVDPGDLVVKDKSCNVCHNFVCKVISDLNARTPGGCSHDDLIAMANGCEDFSADRVFNTQSR